jgi:hypothetical protein
MSERVPTLDEFKSNVEALLGQSLTVPASEAAEDFLKHWASFSSLIAERTLEFRVDVLFLCHNFPQYKRYQVWKGVGTIGLLPGIISVWFFWQLGAALIALALGLYLWGGYIKFNDAKNFAEELMKEATLNPWGDGYARLCASYISGIIQLVSPTGSSVWPQFPSNAVTGERSFISIDITP